MDIHAKRAISESFARGGTHLLADGVAPVTKVARRWSERALEPLESDASYFHRRSAEERASAAGAQTDLTRALHLELAQRYAGLSAAIRKVEGEPR